VIKVLFDTMSDLVEYLAVEYPKSKGKELASWHTSPLSMCVGVYEGEDLMQGFLIYKDPKREHKWVLLDNMHADLATRNYVEYVAEFTDAISFFEEVEAIFSDEDDEEEDEDFFFTLD
jgi:hypothetical protein